MPNFTTCSSCQKVNLVENPRCVKCGATLPPPFANPSSPAPFAPFAPSLAQELIKKQDDRIRNTLLAGLICWFLTGVLGGMSSSLHLSGLPWLLFILIEMATTIGLFFCHVFYCYFVGNKKGYPLMFLLGFVPFLGAILASVWPTKSDYAGYKIAENPEVSKATPSATSSYWSSIPVSGEIGHPKGSYRGVYIVLGTCVILFALCGGALMLGQQHSGFILDGRELTSSQFQTGKQEVKEFMKGGYNSITEESVATSPLSIKLKNMFVNANKEDLEIGAVKRGFDQVKTENDILGSQNQRDSARLKFKKFDQKLTTYLDKRIKMMHETESVVKKIDGVPSAELRLVTEKLDKCRRDYIGVQKVRSFLIDFVDTHPHQTSGDKQILFVSDADVKAYNVLTQRYIAAIQRLQTNK